MALSETGLPTSRKILLEGGKAGIKKEAATVLDKILQVVLKSPEIQHGHMLLKAQVRDLRQTWR